MTPAEARARVAAIAKIGAPDPEVAHSLEDGLYLDALRAIAAGAPNAADLAREALAAYEIEFPRWYA